MVLDAGKRVEQADAEVSEAIDFAEYYARSFASTRARIRSLELDARGVGARHAALELPARDPGGRRAGRADGRQRGDLKPALETVLVAERLAQICWARACRSDALQLVLCEDELGSALDPRRARRGASC